MKKVVLIVLSFFWLIACKKNDSSSWFPNDYVSNISKALLDSLPMADYLSLDIAQSKQTHVDSANIHLLRIPLIGKDISHDFLVVQKDGTGKIKRGNYINIIGTETVNQTLSNSGSAATFNGQISYRSLNGIGMDTYRITNGHIQHIKAISTDHQLYDTKNP